MTPAEILTTIRENGLTVRAEGSTLVIKPRRLLAEPLRELAIAHKTALIEILTQPEAQRQPAEAAPPAPPPAVIRPGTQTLDINVIMVTAPYQLQQALPRILASPVIGLDIETTGLDPLVNKVRLVQLATRDCVYVVDAFQLDPRVLQPVINHAPWLVTHAGVFELRFLETAGLTMPDDLGFRIGDTMLAHQLLTAGLPELYHRPAGPPGSKGGELVEMRRKGVDTLESIATRYCQIELDKRFQSASWSGPLTEAHLRYAATDAAVLLPLTDQLHTELIEAGMASVARCEFGAMPAVAWLRNCGAPIDTKAWLEQADQAEAKRDHLEACLVEVADINWNSPAQVLKVLRGRGVDLSATNVDALKAACLQDPEAIGLLLDHRKASKLAGTYGREFVKKHVHPVDGRIHASFWQVGAKTGRMSCSSPNLQQVPNDTAYRRCVRPADGRVLVAADLSQVEPRILAEICQDQALLKLFVDTFRKSKEEGGDVYRLIAGELGIERKVAKIVLLGVSYGLGAPGLVRNLRRLADLEVTEDEAKDFLHRLLNRYRGLDQYRRRIGNIPNGQPTVVRTLLGRRRLNVQTFTRRLNTPVQGSAADGFKIALAELYRTRKTLPGVQLVLAVHDEVVVECSEEAADQAQAWLKRHLEAGTQALLKFVPVEVDVHMGRDWAEAKP